MAAFVFAKIIHLLLHVQCTCEDNQRLSGRVLDLISRSRFFKPRYRHYKVSMGMPIYPFLVLAQQRKHPDMTEKL